MSTGINTYVFKRRIKTKWKTGNVLYVIAHNIRSAQNIGAVFRSADGAGVRKIFLTGYSPRPFLKDQEAYRTKAQKMIAKTALGAENEVLWERVSKIHQVMEDLKKEGFQIIALELAKKSTDIFSFRPQFPCALIMGNEVRGINEKIIGRCDKIVSIPMRGKKESLNVSVAAGLAFYMILNK